jgi:hypothetical protein
MNKFWSLIVVLLTAVSLVALRFAWYSHFDGVALAALPASVISHFTADPKITLMGFADSLLLAIGVAWFAHQTGNRSIGGGLIVAVAVFILFVMTSALQPYIYGGQLNALTVPKALLIDGGYLLLSLVVAGVLSAFIPRKRRKSSLYKSVVFDAQHADTGQGLATEANAPVDHHVADDRPPVADSHAPAPAPADAGNGNGDQGGDGGH